MVSVSPPNAEQSNGVPEILKFSKAEADFAQEGFPPQNAIDGQPKTGWAIHGPDKWNVARRATFTLENPIALQPGTRCTIRLEQQYGGQHTLGRFRVRLGEPIDDDRPAEVRAAEHRDRRFNAWHTAESVRTGRWELLRPVSATSKIPTLAIEPDGSVFASGDQSKRDEYQVTYASDLRGITALRLEVLPDDRLPKARTGQDCLRGSVR